MKILIIYASVTGTSKKCVDILKNNLAGHSVTVRDLENEKVSEESLSDYDTVIVGGPVRYGKLHKAVQRFIKEREDELSAHRTAYFLCAAYADRIDDYFEDFLTDRQRKNALSLSNFGGDLSVDRQKNLFMKLLVRAIRNDITENGETDDIATSRVLPTVNPTEISKLADIVKDKSKQ